MDSFVVYVYIGNHVKEFVLPHMMDGRQNLNLYAFETGYAEDIIIMLDVSNGVWKVISKDTVRVVSGDRYEKECVIRPDDVINLAYGNKDSNIRITVIAAVKNDDLFNFSKYFCQSMKEITIGRSAGNIVMYNAPAVSSKHAVISFESDGTYIKDNRSQNGVYVNRQKVSSARLNFGDVIFIMGLKIVFFGNFIAVNNPKNAVKCKIFQHMKSAFTEDDHSDTHEDDADSSANYFNRGTRIEKKLLVDTEEIDPPPEAKGKTSMPLIYSIGPSLTMGLAMVVGVAFTFNSQKNNPSLVLPSLITTVAMLIGAVLWPIFTQRHNDKNAVQAESLRLQKYRQYINDTYVRLQNKLEHNRSVLIDTHPAVETCVTRVKSADSRIWERTPSNEDFMDLRVGRGVRPFTVEINIPKEHFSVEDDPLKKEMSAVAEQFQYITNVPITIPFARETMVGVVGDRKEQINLTKCLLVQLTALHSYTESKLIFIYNKNEEHIWSFIKWLPHSWAAGKSSRYVATAQDEVRETFLELSSVLAERKKDQTGYFNIKKEPAIPHFVIFVAEPKLIENEPVIKMLLEEQENIGVTLVLLYKEINMLPNQCNAIVQCASDTCSVYYKNDPTGKMQKIDTDTAHDVNMTVYAKLLSRIKVKEQFAEASLPTTLTFLEMYNAGKVEDLIIEKRWGISEPYKTLETVVGVGSGNQAFDLNIHEKYHGPHGLVAGMTGSGKSEFIQTYILSMAVNYHPYDVSFILIDYKGGGMANCFTGMPHVAGTITNLGGNSVHRSLVSLQSELKRRQGLFAEVNVNHIDKYQQLWKEGKAKEPLPHLVIISDEFAQLKSQQPEFMRELVSAAQIGRSLGVHLILATQKPSGVVDNQIWSNTNFRVCLKVLDAADSNEMLKRPEASLIKIPGRGYVQVGNDEIFEMVQTAWSGAPYFPTDKVVNEESKTILLLDTCGRAHRAACAVRRGEKTSDSQLSAIVDHITRYAQTESIQPLSLWLPPLDTCIGLEDIENRKGGFNGVIWEKTEHLLNPAIGAYDDPSTQKQGTLYIDFIKDGHLTLFGAPSTGKTTFIQTLVYSLVQSYSPEAVSIYILDFGGRSMGYFDELPHVGNVLLSEDEEKIGKLFKMLNRELNERKRIFSEIGVGSYKAYLDSSSKNLPAFFIIVDNNSVFGELYPDYEQELIFFSSQGANYGIYLVLTANNQSGIKHRVTQNIKQSLTLQLNDKFEYISLVGQTNGLTPDLVPGRGLAKLEYPVEYQTALALHIENEADRTVAIKKVFASMNKCWDGYRAKNVPVVPEDLSLNFTLDNIADLSKGDQMMLGYDLDEAEPVFADMKRTSVFTVLGGDKTGKTNMLMCLIKLIKTQYDWQVWVIDNSSAGLKDVSDEYNADEYCCDEETLEVFMKKLHKTLSARSQDLNKAKKNITDRYDYLRKYPKIIVLMDGYEHFYNIVSDSALDTFDYILKKLSNLGAHFIISENNITVTSYSGQKTYDIIFNGADGILLGGGLDRDIIYNVNAPYQQKSMTYEAGKGYLINKNSFKVIKTPYYN